MLRKNKIGKYFKYAIGEIVLVVIGILIALGINNWNESIKINKKTNNYLKALNTEIETNINVLEEHISIVHRDIEESAKTRKLLNISEAKFYNDSVLKYSMISRPIYKANLVKSTFNDLINSGILENIDDLKLKNNILSIPSSIDILNENYLNARDSWINYQLPYLMKYADVSNNWDSLSGIKIEKLPFKRIKKAFIYNSEYANILALRMRMVNNYEETLIELRENLSSISKNIKLFLKE